MCQLYLIFFKVIEMDTCTLSYIFILVNVTENQNQCTMGPFTLSLLCPCPPLAPPHIHTKDYKKYFSGMTLFSKLYFY